jgi:bifunctional enzyme CysN/CysC
MRTKQHHNLEATPACSSGLTVWLTGLPGSGKTTTAVALRSLLEGYGRVVVLLDGDVLRAGVSSDLGFSNEDRDENVRRTGEFSLMLAQQGVVVVASLVSPRRTSRDAVRERHDTSAIRFIEVHIDASLEVCEQRDPKGLYHRTRAGTMSNMTGVDDPYEAPLQPELRLATGVLGLAETSSHLADEVLKVLRDGERVDPPPDPDAT